MVRWSGFADLVFAESARLAFAKAAELADTDAHEEHAEAWIIQDRQVTFSIETESGRPLLEGMRRFLVLLALQAESGEAVLEVAEGGERWVCRAATPSVSKELAVDPEDEAPESRTIRVGGA
jgi:hypothetical protein